MESVQRNQQRLQHQHSSSTTTLHSNDNSNEDFDTAMIVTGCVEHPISTQVLEIVTNLPDSAPPVLLAHKPTDQVMQGLYSYTPKLNAEDGNRVDKAVQHYEPYIDFDLLLERVEIKDYADPETADDAVASSSGE